MIICSKLLFHSAVLANQMHFATDLQLTRSKLHLKKQRRVLSSFDAEATIENVSSLHLKTEGNIKSIFSQFSSNERNGRNKPIGFQNEYAVAYRRKNKYRSKFKVIQVQTESAYVFEAFNCEHNM